MKSAVTDFWEKKLCYDAAELSSLTYFKSQFYSLSNPHLIWVTAGSNPYEVEKAVTQARMISGRYRCEKLRRHWSQNTAGYCELEPCFSDNTVGSLEHMLLDCKGLSESRSAVLTLWRRKLESYPALKLIIQNLTNLTSVQFLLDPGATPEVITDHIDTE